jgi:hypothetical protein
LIESLWDSLWDSLWGLFQPGEASVSPPRSRSFSAFRRERPARALGRPGRPDFLDVR